MKYIKGRTNLSATIFVPYDCDNNCPFCTSKKDYKDCSKFNLNEILNKINKLNKNPIIQEYVITGGEPFANINGLIRILNVCKKPVYINTTLPIKTIKESIEIINNYSIINGVNISRHIGFEFKNVASLDDIDRIKKSIRINTVMNDNFDFDKFFDFVNKYGKKKRDINLRADYTKIDISSLKSRDYVFYNLATVYDYICTESCIVCNTEYFSVNDEFLVSYHRGMEHSCVCVGDKYYVNDILIKQDGNIYKDWNCIEDKDFEKWILMEE